MTTVAYRDGVIAADRMAVNGSRCDGRLTKIHKINGHLLGISGNAAMGSALIDWFKGGCLAEAFPGCESDEDDASLLVINPDRHILVYESNRPVPIQFESEWMTRGSGGDFASAAFMMGADARRAVEIACELDAYSGGGIDVLSLD